MKFSICTPRLRHVRRSYVPALSTAIAGAMFGSAHAVPLVFDTTVEVANGSNIIGGNPTSPVYTGPTLHFLNVATDDGQTVDARVSVLSLKDETNFGNGTANRWFGDTGFMPNYSQVENGPSGDLGVLFDGLGLNLTENGLKLRIDFFDGSEGLSGTFTTAVVVQTLNLAIYDVDGETGPPGSTQSEFFRVNPEDGFVGYALGDTPQALTASNEDDWVRFDGPGQNFAETDASGAVRLDYENTTGLTVDFGSVMTSGSSPNPVFFAIDGDLGLFSDDDFMTPSPVPLGDSLPLFATGIIALGFARRRNRMG